MVSGVVLAQSDADQARTEKDARFNVYVDDPSFRAVRMMIPHRIVHDEGESVGPKASHKGRYASSLKVFTTYLRDYLELTAIFKVYELAVYGPPFFPWPAPSQSLQSWLATRPRVVVKGHDVLDMVVMVQVQERQGQSPLFVLQVVDLRAATVRFRVSYDWLGKERDVARTFADALLSHITGGPGIFSSRIVFIGKQNAKSPKQVYTVRIDGSDLRQISQGPYIHLSPSWTADGKGILFTSYQSGGPDIYLHDVSSGKTRKISGAAGMDSGGQHDPLSSTVVFSGSDRGDADIYTVQLDGKKRGPLIRGKGVDVDPTFSPNGKWLAFVSGRFGNPHIFLAHLDRRSSSLRVTKDQRLTWAGWYNGNPAFSPDSKKIAFAGYDKETDRFDIFMMDVDGKNLERLTLKNADNESPSWSPHGQLLVFHSNRVGTSNIKGQSGLYIMRRDGSGQRKIPLPLYLAQTPKWGPALRP